MSYPDFVARNIPGSRRSNSAEQDPEQGIPGRARRSSQVGVHADFHSAILETNQRSDLQEADPEATRESTIEDLEALYKSFQSRFRKNLENLQTARDWNKKTYEHAKWRYVPEGYARRQAVDPLDRTRGFIAYFAPGEIARKEEEFPIRELIESNSAYAKMDKYWSDHCGEKTEIPLYRWVHIPANNKQWVEQAMHHILDFYYGKAGHKDTILQPEYWSKQEVRVSNPEGGRSMKPLATVVREKENPSAFLRDPSVIALYLPYLHWERSVTVAYMNQIAKDVKHYDKSYRRHADRNGSHIEDLVGPYGPTDELLLRKYLHCGSPLHMRRTLDQFYHVDLQDTSERDRDQAISRYAERRDSLNKRNAENEPPVLMVDQCWIWVIGTGGNRQTATILTCFPTAWSHFDQPHGEGSSDPLDMRQKIIRGLESRVNDPDTPRRFMQFLIEQFLNNILKVPGSLELRYRFIDQYSLSLAQLVTRQADCFKNFWKNVASPNEDKAAERLHVFDEFEMFQEAKDIVDELQMIQKVQKDQKYALEDVERNGRPDKDFWGKGLGEDFKYFPSGPLWGVQGRRKRDLDGLLAQATDVVAEISRFLELKQQYAAISEAQSLRSLVKDIDRLGDQSDVQGDTLMIFTIVTVVFLPLSTLASFFGMNAAELGSGSLSIGIIFAYVFPISFFIAAVAILFAFGVPGLRQKRRRDKSIKGRQKVQDGPQEDEGKLHRSSAAEMFPEIPGEIMRNMPHGGRALPIESSSEESSDD